MIDNGVRSNDHMSRVATWVLNTIGKALALSVLVAVVFAAAAAVLQQPLVLLLSGLLGPITFAAVLYNADAPLDD